jgi:drug/metabolite transporter (DMT)-like permease
VYYTLTQGSQFLSLAYLSAATASLLLNLTPLVVGISGIVFLGEHPSRSQWLGIALTLLGVAIFFLPLNMRVAPVIGLLVAFGGVVSNAASSLLGRQVNRLANSSPIVITFTSMGIGSLALLLIGVLFQGFGELDLRGWLLIAWLAVVNTAFAFTLWNHTLRTLSAVESSVINSLMMPQIAILAYVFLGEALNGKELLGLVLVGLGVLVVQLQRKPAQQEAVPSPEASAR